MIKNLYMGWDLSTTQLKCIVVDSKLKHIHEAKVQFDIDFGEKYKVENGVLSNVTENEIFAPVAMWLEAVDLVLERLKEQKLDFSRIAGVSGAGMQHGTVFWNHDAESLLSGLNGGGALVEQLSSAFASSVSPNWQDASTQEQCDEFDVELGSPEELANNTGSKAHHMMRFRQKHPDKYANTSRISLVSSFLASLFLGRIADIDISDVCGMNLWDIERGTWNEQLLKLCAGGAEGVKGLTSKLGLIHQDGGKIQGAISKYFVQRYGFNSNCGVVSFTGDNPATMLALPLQPTDAIVSLGTSTTFLMSTSEYRPDPSYHFMNHPTTPGLYMFMLCYKNGSLARERAKDALNAFEAIKGAAAEDGESKSGAKPSKSWDFFNKTALETPPLGIRAKDEIIQIQSPLGDAVDMVRTPNLGKEDNAMKMGLFFPRPEIVPRLPAGTWTYLYTPPSSGSDASVGGGKGENRVQKPRLRPVRPISTPSTSTYSRASQSTSSSTLAVSTSTTDSSSIEEEEDEEEQWYEPHDNVRATLESQFLSCRLRSRNLVKPQPTSNSHAQDTSCLPAQPRRIYIVGGGALNPAITQICGEVMGGSEGVFRLDIGGNACALGGAYKAVWAIERGERVETGVDGMRREAANETFEDFVQKRWTETDFVKKVDVGYRKGIWERYGAALEGFEMMEEEALRGVYG